MRKIPLSSCLVASALSFLSCNSDSDNSGSAAGSGGSQTDAGQGSNKDSGAPNAADVDNPDPINDDCPVNDIGPMEGPFAQKGSCCYRTSNIARIDETADTRTLEFRTNYFMLVNHLKTIDPAVFGATIIDRMDNEEQSLLFRLVLPQKDGELTEGKGSVKIGPGRYNCDGTYSFYSESAAAEHGGAGDRWFVPEIELEVNPDQTDENLIRAPFMQSLPVENRPSYLPYLGGAPNFSLDWEAVSQGFAFVDLPLGPDNYDCIGSRKSSGKWSPGGMSLTYGRLDLNDKDVIDLLGITFCQLMAFGASPDAPDCQATQRCMPGEADCKWVRLPDSLCPVTDEERASWGCHLGWDGNPDNGPVKLNCSDDPPENIDPDNGTVEGQCCDPLGRDDSGLPACNAWVQISELTAAAVEITDEPADELQRSCHGK